MFIQYLQPLTLSFDSGFYPRLLTCLPRAAGVLCSWACFGAPSYKPGERRSVRTHLDIAAFVTAIATLNAEDFGGGYFLTSKLNSTCILHNYIV